MILTLTALKNVNLMDLSTYLKEVIKMNNDAFVCCVCALCADKECKQKELNKFCTPEWYERINKDLKVCAKCYVPPECGSYFCNLPCYKEVKNESGGFYE